MKKRKCYKQVVVIGAGPAGLSVTSELIKNSVSVKLFESDRSGGKINIAPRIDNYPNYESIEGTKLATNLVNKAINSGVTVTYETVNRVWKDKGFFYTETDESVVTSDIVVVASGTKPRILEISGISENFGNGVFCNAVDNLSLCKNKVVAVIGGGNSALKEALFLSNYVKNLYLIHRRTEFRGLRKLVDELCKVRSDKKNIEILTPFIPEEILDSDGKVTGLILKNSVENYEMKIDVDAVCLSVGQVPNTEIIQIPEVKFESGYIVTDRQMNTSVSGLFAIGDVIDRSTKQIYLSEHDGKVAAENIINYLKVK